MARCTISREFPDGDVLHVTVVVEGSYPDAVNEARVNARGLYADAMDITFVAADEDDGE